MVWRILISAYSAQRCSAHGSAREILPWLVPLRETLARMGHKLVQNDIQLLCFLCIQTGCYFLVAPRDQTHGSLPYFAALRREVQHHTAPIGWAACFQNQAFVYQCLRCAAGLGL